MTADLLRKLALYARAAVGTRSANLGGLPLIPKALYAEPPYNREAYNNFLLWIRQLGLTSASRVFDIGANHGDFAAAASACFPQAEVWLFEPLPLLWPKLGRMAARRAGRWHVQPLAMGAAAGTMSLQISAEDDTIGSFVGFDAEYRKMNPGARSSESIDSRVDTLDGFCAREGVSVIDLMKLDVEGFEFEVLAGGPEMLHRTNALIVEVSLVRQAGGSPEPLRRMIDELTRAGFYLVGLIPSIFSREEPWKPMEYNLLLRRPGPGTDAR